MKLSKIIFLKKTIDIPLSGFKDYSMIHWVKTTTDMFSFHHSDDTYRQENTFTPTGTLDTPGHLTRL